MSEKSNHLMLLSPTATSATSRDIEATCRATDSDTPLRGVSRVVSGPLKQCAECSQLKPRTTFLPSRATADGLVARCRDCILREADRNRMHREHLRSRHNPSSKTKSSQIGRAHV
jgi:hypothetical protein